MASNTVIVIIPGGFFSPKPYDAVAGLLRQRGFTVLVPELQVTGDLTGKTPESSEWKKMAATGAVEDTKYIHSQLLPLLDEGREAVIVGHSYGSLPGTLCVEGQTVAERAAKGLKGGIKAYICAAGFAYPTRGLNVMGQDEDLPLMPYHTLEKGILHLDISAKALFFSDVSPEVQDTAWSQCFLFLSRKSLLLRPNFLTSDMKIPKTYLYGEKDETVVPEYQDAFVKIGAFDNVVKLPCGHTSFVSMPDKVAEVIADVAKA